MNTLTTIPSTMSSREIAELTGKDHKHVLRDIRDVLDQLEIDSAQFWAQYIDSTGRSLSMFNLPKDLTTTLVSGYSIPMRHKIVTRWMELESKQAHALPQTFTQALRLALEKAEQLEVAQAQLGAALVQVEAMKPAVEFVENFVECAQSQTITEVAKAIGVKPRTLTSCLTGDGVLYRRSSTAPVLPAQEHIDNGRFVLKQFFNEWGHSCPQTRVTPKGVVWLAKRYGNS